MTSDGLKKRTARNLGFNAVAKVVMFGLQAVANIILTRTLGADDYGLVALAIIFVNFFTLFGDIGITNAVIRKENLTDQDVRTGFTLRVLQGIVLAIIGVAAAPLASAVFNNDEVGKILAVFGFNFVINSLGFMPYIYLSRELRYDRLFIPQVGYALVGSIVAIVLALAGFRHWSLVLSTLSSSVAYVMLLHIMRPSRLAFSFDTKTAHHFFSYGVNIFLVGVVGYALLNAGNFCIGAAKGPRVLGFYTIAATWGGMICSIVTAVFSSVLFPTFAQIQNDKVLLRAAYLKITGFIGTVSVVVNLTLCLVSKDFVFVVLGHNSEKWFPSLLALQILCFLGVVKSIIEPGASLLNAVGNTAVAFRATLAAAVVQVGLIYPALKFGGIEGVAILILFATSLQIVFYATALKETLDLWLLDLIKQLVPALFASVFTLGVFVLCTPLMGQLSLWWLIAKTLFVLMLYLVSFGYVTRWKVYSEIRGILNDFIFPRSINRGTNA